jgi:pimeloyl-ACP methyl ester carboxylesterase
MSLPATPTSPTATADITVVLVHGAFADASGWSGVIAGLQQRGHVVVAPPNPLRGLVYVAGFAPDEGELLGAVESGSKDSVLNSALVPRHYPTGPAGQTATEFGIDPAKFHDAFAADLPAELATVMAATQRPIAEAAFTDPSGPPAWKRLPSWAVVATGDLTIGTDLVRRMAERAGAHILELEGSHVIMISRPDAVLEVIGTALQAVAKAAADLPTPKRPQEETAEGAVGRTP